MAIVVDTYNESNSNEEQVIYDATHPRISQSFTPSSSGILNSAKFYCIKYASATGDAYSKIYAHTGTWGSSGEPTGAALATSAAVDVSGIDTSLELTTFTFSGASNIQLNFGTLYTITLEYDDGSVVNAIGAGYDLTGSHQGNGAVDLSGTWYPQAVYDFCFYVYINDDPCRHTAGICVGSV